MPQDEEARLAAVARYELVGSAPEDGFDRIAQLAACLFAAPTAIISVVGRDRVWFKSHPGVLLEEVPRRRSSLAPVIFEPDACVIADAQLHSGARADPLTSKLGIRFYAAAPLTTPDGFALGTLSVIDTKARAVGEHELTVLGELAAVVVDALELRRAVRTEEQRLEQARADFAATASHELKTPLAAVYGAAKTLAREDGAISAETRARLLSVLSEQGERLRDMFEEVLTTSQLDSGGFRLSPEAVDPAAIVSAVAEAARAHLPDGLSIELEIGDDLPSVVADPRRLRQVIENLLDNAIKYSPSGGCIRVGVDAAEETIRFWVRDRGPGIPGAERERIFRRFYRRDADIRSAVGGSGLGLYVSQQLARRMGGWIEVDSAEGSGSTFLLVLPLCQPKSGLPS